MNPQHEFPKDWRKISNEEVKKHIEYLLEHYQEYDIDIWDGGNSLIINGIVFQALHAFQRKDGSYGYYLINSQKVVSVYEDVFNIIEALKRVCKKEVKKREKEIAKREKKETKKQKRKKIIEVAMVIVLLAGFGAILCCMAYDNKKERIKQNKIENEIKKYEKTLPYYNEYLQTKQQIQNRRDSLEKVY